MNRVTVNSSILKMVSSLQLKFSQPQLHYVSRFINGILLSPGKRTVSNIQRANFSDRDASCFTRFLKESPWNEEHLQTQRIQKITDHLKSQKGDSPSVGFLLLDDSGMTKSHSTQHIEGLDFHYSHSEGKSVWSHSLVTSHVVSQGYSLPWEFQVYRRKEDCEAQGLSFQSKIDLAAQLVKNYDSIDDRVYVMADSWYSSEKLIHTCETKGFFYIGALKANAIVYPWGYRTSVSQLVSVLQPQDLHSVTVKGKRYDVFAYEGRVSQIDNAIVLLSWEGGYDPDRFPFLLICTDVSLNSETILAYYCERWNIETGYRYLKENQGIDQYQIRSLKAIRRYWTLQFLTYTYLELRRHELKVSTLGDVIHQERMAYLGRLILYAYEQGLRQIPFKHVLNEFSLSA